MSRTVTVSYAIRVLIPVDITVEVRDGEDEDDCEGDVLFKSADIAMASRPVALRADVEGMSADDWIAVDEKARAKAKALVAGDG